jgi:hypothetical protein
MSFNLSEVDQVHHADFFNQITDGGATHNTSWSANVNDLQFVPDFAIVKSVMYQTNELNDISIYHIRSSLGCGKSIGTFPGSNNNEADAPIQPIINNPEQVIKIGEPVRHLDFSIQQYATDGTNGKIKPSFTTAKKNSILVEVDFIKLKKK